MKKKPKISIIGLSGESVFMNVDHFHQSGETIISENLHIEPGGKGYNQAVAVSRLGAESHFLSTVGDDDYGKVCEEVLIHEGVNPYLIRKKDSKTAFATIITNKEGDNQVTVYKGASTKLSVEDINNFEETIKTSDVLLLQLEVSLDVTRLATEIAINNNVIVILNPAPAMNIGNDLLTKVWAITPNEIEAKILFGLNEDSTINDVINKILESDVNRVVITLGSKGSIVIEEKNVTIIPSIKIETIDTTGAGDVFNAALTVKISQGFTLVDAAKYANIAAGLSVSKKFVLDSIPKDKDVKNYI